MAQTGVVLLTVNKFPEGQDMTQRRDCPHGVCAINTVTGTPIAITAFAISSNVITYQAVNTLAGTETITVSGFASANSYANATLTLTSATGTTMVASLTHADVATVTHAASAVLTPQYVTGGLPLTWTSMADGNFGGLKPYQSTWGPHQTQPKTAHFFSTGGGLTTLPGYSYVFDTTLNTLRIFAGATELTNAANITPDVIGFEAEYIKSGY